MNDAWKQKTNLRSSRSNNNYQKHDFSKTRRVTRKLPSISSPRTSPACLLQPPALESTLGCGTSSTNSANCAWKETGVIGQLGSVSSDGRTILFEQLLRSISLGAWMIKRNKLPRELHCVTDTLLATKGTLRRASEHGQVPSSALICVLNV